MLIIVAAGPRAGVNAWGLVSRITSNTCQCCRIPLRAKPMRPMSHVNVTARMKSAYCERAGIWPQRMAPRDVAPLIMNTSRTMTKKMHASTASTW